MPNTLSDFGVPQKNSGFRPRIHWLDQQIVKKQLDIWFWANLETFLRISPNLEFFFKNPAVTFLPLKPLTSCKKSEKFLEPFLRKLGHQQTNQPNIEVSDFALIWRRFPKYLQIKIFIKNLALSLFYLYSPLTYCTKSEKSFEPFLRKLHYQPTNYYQQHQSYRISLMPVQQHQSHRTSLMPVQKSEFLLLIF